jgi:hypothetical protein
MLHILIENIKEKDQFGDLGINILFKLIWKELGGIEVIGFIWFMIERLITGI